MVKEKNGQPAVSQLSSKPGSNSWTEPALCQTAPCRGMHQVSAFWPPCSCSPCHQPGTRHTGFQELSKGVSCIVPTLPTSTSQTHAPKCIVQLGPNATQKIHPPSVKPTLPKTTLQTPMLNRKLMSPIHDHSFPGTLLYKARICYFKNSLPLVLSPH